MRASRAILVFSRARLRPRAEPAPLNRSNSPHFSEEEAKTNTRLASTWSGAAGATVFNCFLEDFIPNHPLISESIAGAIGSTIAPIAVNATKLWNPVRPEILVWEITPNNFQIMFENVTDDVSARSALTSYLTQVILPGFFGGFATGIVKIGLMQYGCPVMTANIIAPIVVSGTVAAGKTVVSTIGQGIYNLGKYCCSFFRNAPHTPADEKPLDPLERIPLQPSAV